MSDPRGPEPADLDVQTCYRHADRRAGVACQRCDRPICPDCMHQASVGFHCPECLQSGGQKVYRGPAAVGAGVATVTATLVALNAAVYVISAIGGGLVDPDGQFVLDWATLGYGRSTAGPIGVGAGDWWRLVTGGFLHGSLIHIGFNMYLLWMLGQQMERVLGRLTFGVVYATSLLAGSFGVILLSPNDLTVGASGAVFGLFGFAISNQRARGINPFDTGLGGLVGINLLLTFVIPGISIGGHIGGLVGGLVSGEVINRLAPRLGWPTWLATGIVGVLGVALAVGGVVLAPTS